MKFFIIGLILGIACSLFFADEIEEYRINKYLKIIEQERKKNEQF